MIIAVDFDGTIVRDAYPAIGDEIPGAVYTLRKLRSEGYQLILWTCRSGKDLARAVKWCAERGIYFTSINQNLRSQIVRYKSDSRKIGASLYIDDRGMFDLPSWDEIYRIVHERCPTESDLLDIEYGFSPAAR